MKRKTNFFAAMLTAIAGFFGGVAPAQEPPTMPPVPREFRGVWVATVTNIDWPSGRSLTTANQQNELRAILNRAQALKMNAIIFQIRPACDALYQSSIEPWSYFLTNLEGRSPNPGWDPLAWVITEARLRGIEVHAWFNPYRAKKGTYTNASNHIAVRRPDLVYTYGSDRWLDPGSIEVQDYSHSVIMDVVNRYDIDAVHFDDYFYPYAISGTPFPDNATYAAYQASGGTMSLGDWRRNNVNTFIQRIQSSIRAAKPQVRFGISPFGIWRPGNPSGIVGLDSYASIYADSRLWLREGWVDYLAPQLYWPIEQTGQEFPKLLDWWVSQNFKQRHIWPGLFTGRIGTGGATLWPVSEIVNQVAITQQTLGSTGHIHFSERAFKNNWGGINSVLAPSYPTQALVPASPWLDNTPPPAPRVLANRASPANPYTLSWTPQPGSETPRLWVSRYHNGTAWVSTIHTQTSIATTLPGIGAQAPGWVAVAAVDNVGNESEYTILRLDADRVARGFTPSGIKAY